MKIRILKLLLLSILYSNSVKSLLSNNTDVFKYQNIIQNIYDYYNCQSITLIYTNKLNQLEDVTILKNLLLSFTTTFLIRTTLVDVRMLSSLFSVMNFNEITKPLVVFFDDDDADADADDDDDDDDNKITSNSFVQFLASLNYLSDALWIIFFPNHTTIDMIAQHVYIPFNCKFMIIKRDESNDNNLIIIELYHTNKNSPMRHDLLGTWSTEGGIQLPKLPFLKRRHNLHNEILRATILAGPGVSIKRNKNNEIIEIGSYCGQMVNIFRDKLNFTLNYEEIHVIGGCMPNGTCTGGVDTMARHISDIFPFDLRISPARMNVMDYTMPLYTTDQRMYIQKPAPKLVWNRYLKPFDSRVWGLIVWLFLIHSIIIICIKILHKRRVVRDLTLDESYKTLSDIFFLSFAAMCNESIPEMSLLSLRITQFTIYTTLTILYAAYSAILITSLAFQTFEPPFTTMEGLMEDGSYDLGILKDSADYDFFQNTSIKILSDLFEKMMSYEASLPTSRIEGLRRICSNDKYAYLAPDISTQYFPAKNCTLIPLNVISRNAPFSMALQYKSPFKDIINYRINALRESGILKKIFKDAEVSDNEIDNSWVTVELPDVFPLIVILLVSYIISLIILIWESIYAKQEKGHHVGDVTRVIVKSQDYLPYRN